MRAPLRPLVPATCPACGNADPGRFRFAIEDIEPPVYAHRGGPRFASWRGLTCLECRHLIPFDDMIRL